MKKRWFQRNLSNFGVGVIVDCEGADEPGGMVSAGAGGDNNVDDPETSDNSGEDTMHRSDTSADTGDADGAGEGDDSSGGDSSSESQGDTSDDSSSEQISALNNKITDLMSIIESRDSNADSDDDGPESGLEHKDLVAMMADDPAAFIGELTKAVEKTVTDRVTRDNVINTYNSEIESTINDYADANTDFEVMWDKGEIQSYIEDNPGHNAISAHMAITMESKMAEATKNGEETAIRNFRLKSNSQVLNNGPGVPPEQRDAALKNPEKFGGRSAVLAMRAGIQ